MKICNVEKSKCFDRTLRRLTYHGALGILVLTSGCADVVNAQDTSMPVCSKNTPFSKVSNSPVSSVSDLVQDSKANLITLRDRALLEPSRSLNIVAGVGLVTLRQSDIPEVQIKSYDDVALTLPSGDSRVTIVFKTDVYGKLNIDPEIFGCKGKSGTAFYHNQLPNIIHSYVTALPSNNDIHP